MSSTPDPTPAPTITTPAIEPASPGPDNIDGLKKKNFELIGELKKSKAQARDAQAKLDAVPKPDPTHVELAPLLVRKGLLVKDGDVDLLDFRLSRDVELKALAAAGDTEALLAKLTERGLVIAPTAEPARSPNMPAFAAPRLSAMPTPVPARPSQGALPGASSGRIETFADLLKMSPEAVVAFSQANPAEYARLKAQHIGALASPGRR
jgi:hypothetical protein